MSFECMFLANPKTENLVLPQILISSPLFDWKGAWGDTQVIRWDLPEKMALREFPLQVRLDSSLGSVSFGYEGLLENDRLILAMLNSRRFLSNIDHVGTRKALCTVRCIDGTSGQGCITCVSGELSVRVCC